MNINLKPINEQVIVIFGASSGIGRQTALDFARRGARLTVAARTESGLQSLVEEIRESGGKAIYIIAEAADFNSVKKVADQTYDHYGQLDTWVHSAGTMILSRFENTTPEEFKRVIEVNLLGQVYGAMAALPYIKKTGQGALIHISSIESVRTVPFQSAYGSSKFGLKGFLQSLRIELQGQGIPIAVTEIMPGPVNTPIWNKARNKFPFKSRPPLMPISHPKVVSDAVIYAAENAVRDIVSGTLAFGVPITERISPQLNDKIINLIGFSQFEKEPHDVNAKDALFDIMPEQSLIEGRFSSEQFKNDIFGRLTKNPKKATGIISVLGGLIGGALIYQFINRSKKSNRK